MTKQSWERYENVEFTCGNGSSDRIDRRLLTIQFPHPIFQPITMADQPSFIPPHGNYEIRLWTKDLKEALFVRNLGKSADETFESYREFSETRPAEVVANIAICLVDQTNYLLDQQIRRLEQDFVHEPGMRERMTGARLQPRNKGFNGQVPTKGPDGKMKDGRKPKQVL